VERLLRYRPDFGIIKRILRIGIPAGVENSMFQFGKLLTQSLVSTLGTASIAANAVAGSLVSMQYAPGAAVNGAIFAVIGQCVGAGEEKQTKRYSRVLIGVLYASLGVIAIGMSLLSGPLVRLYGLEGESFLLARRMLILHSMIAMLIWPLGFGLPNCFNAAGHVKFTLFVSASSMWIFRVAGAYLLALPSLTVFGLVIPGAGMGVMGVWAAMFIDWGLRGIMYTVRYLRGRWVHAAHK
jgi:Na+-driven multidrug efflux pump